MGELAENRLLTIRHKRHDWLPASHGVYVSSAKLSRNSFGQVPRLNPGQNPILYLTLNPTNAAFSQ